MNLHFDYGFIIDKTWLKCEKKKNLRCGILVKHNQLFSRESGNVAKSRPLFQCFFVVPYCEETVPKNETLSFPEYIPHVRKMTCIVRLAFDFFAPPTFNIKKEKKNEFSLTVDKPHVSV